MKRILIILAFLVPFAAIGQNLKNLTIDTLTNVKIKARTGGKVTVQDSLVYAKGTINTVLGLSGTKGVKSYSIVDLSTLGLATLADTVSTLATQHDVRNKSEWNLVSGTYASTTKFYFTGAVANDLCKYMRALVKIVSKRVAATNEYITTDKFFISGHGQENGSIIRFMSGTLPTVTGSAPLELNRAYYIVNKETDSLKIAETPSGTAINLTSVGTNVKVSFQKQGYVSAITPSAAGTTDTITVVSSANLANTDSLFYLANTRKSYDFQEFSYTGSVEVIADASNPQGRRLLDTKQAAYVFSVNSALGTAATGGTPTCTWNMYVGTQAMFTSAPAMAGNATLNAKQPDAAWQYIAQGSNLSFRVTAVSGNPAFLQWQFYLIPVCIYGQD